MFGGSDTTDKALLKLVNQRLTRGTGSSSRLSATVQAGTVTITGKLQYEGQRSPLLKLVARVQGVRRVIDRLTLMPKNVYATPAPRPKAAAPAEAEAAPAADSPLLETPPAVAPAIDG